MGPIDTRWISATPTVDTNIYASGDTIGSLMTFTGALAGTNPTGTVVGVKIDDKNKVAVDLKLVLFSSTPAGTFTDNAAFDPTDAGLANICAVIPITTHHAFNDNGLSVAEDIAYAVRAEKTAATHEGQLPLYGYLVSGGTPTYASASDVKVWIKVMQG